jgi:hypothetical protein
MSFGTNQNDQSSFGTVKSVGQFCFMLVSRSFRYLLLGLTIAAVAVGQTPPFPASGRQLQVWSDLVLITASVTDLDGNPGHRPR